MLGGAASAVGPPPEANLAAACATESEIGILMGIPRTANVVATSDCSCAVPEASLLREALTDARASSALRDGVRTRLERTTTAISSEDGIAASA